MERQMALPSGQRWQVQVVYREALDQRIRREEEQQEQVGGPDLRAAATAACRDPALAAVRMAGDAAPRPLGTGPCGSCCSAPA
jgi:hypothetical protein